MRFFACLFLLFAFPAAVLCQISLKIKYTNHIVLDGQVNDEWKARLVLDSGADGLYLDSAYFASTSLPAHRRQLASLPGAGGEAQRVMVILDTLTVSFEEAQYIPRYTPLLHLRPILGKDVDGIIGLSFLREYLSELDYDKGTLVLHEPNNYTIPTDYQPIDVEIINNRMYVPLEVTIKEGLVIKEKFQIDLGNGGSLDITSPTAVKYNLESNVTAKLHYRNAYGGVGGEIKGNQFRARSVKIGNYKIDLPVIDYSEDSAGALSKKEFGGLLGNEILEQFSVLFDLKNSRVLLKAKNRKTSFHSTLTGFSYADRRDTVSGLLITGVYDNTDADKAGFQIDDVITHINGIDVNALEIEQIRDVFKALDTSVELLLKTKDGQIKRSIKLRDYL